MKTTLSGSFHELTLLAQLPRWVRRDQLISEIKGKPLRFGMVRISDNIEFFTVPELVKLTAVVKQLQTVRETLQARKGK